ncbi:hypothetical protein Tco_1208709 [Tanacetum coccineum]
MTKTANEQGFLSAAYERKPYENLNTCLFFCFVSQEEPKRVTKALSDSAWVEAIIEAIRLFLAYASFMGFMVYQMDVKSPFLYGQIEEEVASSSKSLMSSIGELTFFLGLQVKQKEDGIFISQDKYVTDILKKFGFQDVRTSSTPMDIEKPLLKDSYGDDVDVHLYRYLKGKPKLDLWYPRDSPFDLVAYSDSDYAGASLDRKSTTGGCQFLGCRLISWHVKRGRDTKIPQFSGPPVKDGDEAVHKELGDSIERAATTASSLEAEQDSDAQTRFETTSKQSNDPPLSRVNTLGSGEDSMKLMELMAYYTKLSELKPEGSEAFYQIVDFLNTSHIKYALIENPKIYISLIQQFWGTATARTTDNEERFLSNFLLWANEAAFTSVDVDAGGAATTDIGLEAGHGSGTMHKTPTRPHASPLLRVHTLGSDEGSLQQNELMDLVTKLTDRFKVLKNDMQQTKKVYSSALTKLILRVKKLEKKERKIFKIDKDPTILLVHPKQDMEYDFDVTTAEGFTTASVPVTTSSATPEVSTAAANLVYIRRSAEKRKD